LAVIIEIDSIISSIIYPTLFIMLAMIHIITINKHMEFRIRTGLEEKNKLLRFIIIYFIILPIEPIIYIYNIFYMKKEIKKL
jgi:hypothetical protein